MTSITFANLEPDYNKLIPHAYIKSGREGELRKACVENLLPHLDLYKEVEARTGVPAAWSMATAMREMSGNVNCYIGNGQSLHRRTTIVPIGRGPFNSFLDGCIDAFRIDGLLGLPPEIWRKLAFSCYKHEGFNGWGYRAKGLPSPYVFGATAVQRPGKFPRDHVWDPNMWDPQLGTLSIIEELVALHSELKYYDDVIEKAGLGAEMPSAVAPHPVMKNTNAEFVQSSLNKIRVLGTPLLVDGNVGRATIRAVANFQQKYRLVADGIPGPKTIAKIKEVLMLIGAG
jgi:lysozyme family protein